MFNYKTIDPRRKTLILSKKNISGGVGCIQVNHGLIVIRVPYILYRTHYTYTVAPRFCHPGLDLEPVLIAQASLSEEMAGQARHDSV